MEVKIINQSNNSLPKYQTEESAGCDLMAFLPQESIFINPLERELIPTGLFLEIPKGYEGQIRPRSGLALKNGITVLNSPGTIDSDYRGEIKILLVNLGRETFEVKSGDRIAQLIISPHLQVSFKEETILSESTRGIGGYGSTGK